MSSSFLVTREPWVRCRLLGGELVRLGLLEVFSRAREIATLESEWAHVDVAILRLLQAVARQAMSGPATLDDWLKLQKDGLPAKKIADYLRHWEAEGRLDLLDEKRPFFQWPGIVVKKPKGMQR